MSSFFTLPASQRKRKRPEAQSASAGARRRTQANDDESISGSDISNDDVPARVVDEDSESDEEEYADEDAGSKRIRLAEQYLANTHKEVLEDGGFDAADVDQENLRRRMGDRLKQDTAESKGKLYRWIGDSLDWRGAKIKALRAGDATKSLTGVAMHGNHIYAVSKDMHLIKWQAPAAESTVTGRRPSMSWKVVARSRGNRKKNAAQHHHGSILCVAASQDGRFVATGGADRKLIVWDGNTLQPLKVFTHHRDAVTALSFRRGSNQLYSASKDRTVKIWSLNELAYVETLFGHQDEVVDVSALAQEKCVTAGARDRTARLWKVVEESQLVFRGGGAPGTTKALQALRRAYEDDSGIELQDDEAYHEGSIDRVAMIDDETFVTVSDNGSLSLWNINKKKAIYTLPLAHGLDPAIPIEQASAEQFPDEALPEKGRGGKQPRWITAIAAVPFSDVFITGSWDGQLRAWKISQDKRRIEMLGALGALEEHVVVSPEHDGLQAENAGKDALKITTSTVNETARIEGIINDLAIIERGDRGNESLLVAAAVGKEHRLGSWKEVEEGKNCVVLFDVHRKTHSPISEEDNTGDDEDFHSALEDFSGFD